MIDELGQLAAPDVGDGSLMDAIDLIVPHQANKTMVIGLAERAGLTADQLYFNIEQVGNTSSASIPLAIHDADRKSTRLNSSHANISYAVFCLKKKKKKNLK